MLIFILSLVCIQSEAFSFQTFSDTITIKKIAIMPFWAKVLTDESVAKTNALNYNKNDSLLALQLQVEFFEKLQISNSKNELELQLLSETNRKLEAIQVLYSVANIHKENDVKKLCALLGVDAIVCCHYQDQGVIGKGKYQYDVSKANNRLTTSLGISFSYKIFRADGFLYKTYSNKGTLTNPGKRQAKGKYFIHHAGKSFPFKKLSNSLQFL